MLVIWLASAVLSSPHHPLFLLGCEAAVCLPGQLTGDIWDALDSWERREQGSWKPSGPRRSTDLLCVFEIWPVPSSKHSHRNNDKVKKRKKNWNETMEKIINCKWKQKAKLPDECSLLDCKKRGKLRLRWFLVFLICHIFYTCKKDTSCPT